MCWRGVALDELTYLQLSGLSHECSRSKKVATKSGGEAYDDAKSLHQYVLRIAIGGRRPVRGICNDFVTVPGISG
jgi:hypothetical protein